MFANVFLLLLTAHWLADYPLQTDRQSTRKAGWIDPEGRHHHGWTENLTHAATHIAASAVLLGATWHLLDHHASTLGLAAGFAWIGASHSLIDRRSGVRWWMEHTGQAGFLARGGAAHVDQTAHIALGLLPSALLIATV